LDPDFLETLFPITMPFIESRTEYTFWSLWSAPLIVATGAVFFGCVAHCFAAATGQESVSCSFPDIRNMSAELASIIANPEGGLVCFVAFVHR
jgi:hypothetical protein